jgi:uncharacterized membrane protein
VGYRPGLFLLLLLLAASSPAAVLTGDWHFDEYGWRGFANELNDFSGNNRHGRASEIIDYTPDGALCGAADLTRSSASDYFSLNRDAINGRRDFSISIWGKMPSYVNQIQTLFSAANSNSPNEVMMVFEPQDRRMALYLNNRVVLYVTGLYPNDDTWHHYIWTRNGTQNCIFYDGAYGCANLSDTDPVYVDINGLVVGQDQDSVGGGFNSGRDWDGYLDELVLYDGALTVGEAQGLYNNYINGRNLDGSPRNCGVPNPVANYRFDQCDWQGGRDVADSSGNGLDGFAVNGVISTIDGQVCGLAEFDGVDDYIAIPDDYRLDIRNELTVTTWVYAQAQASELKTILSIQTLLYQLVMGTVLMLVTAFILGQTYFNPSTEALISLGFQSIMVSFVAFMIWFWLLNRYLASRIGVLSFMTPIIGVVLGAWLLDEPITDHFVLGSACVLCGVVLVSAYGLISQRVGRLKSKVS